MASTDQSLADRSDPTHTLSIQADFSHEEQTLTKPDLIVGADRKTLEGVSLVVVGLLALVLVAVVLWLLRRRRARA